MAPFTGRPQDNVWSAFIKLTPNSGFKTTRARCKKCSKEMSSLVKRMKDHLLKCQIGGNNIELLKNNENECDMSSESSYNHVENGLNFNKDDSFDPNNDTRSLNSSINMHKTLQYFSSEVCDINSQTASTSNSSYTSSVMTNNQQKSKSSVGDLVIQTTHIEKKSLDLQIAKFVYATNTPFRHVEHTEFIKLINQLRPDYKLPDRHNIGNNLLDEVFNDTLSEIKALLKGKSVCMSMDGWSNIHNEPIVFISVYDIIEKSVYLVETIDTQDYSHNSECLLNLAVEAIKNCQKYECIVRSFVTDNAANMAKMRDELVQIDEIAAANNNERDIITYGCSAHILNLLAHDLEVNGLRSSIKHIIKYFKNSHKMGAKYKQAGGKTLILPSDVRWNTFSDCLQSYLENWHILSSVCSNNRAAIDTTIIRKIEDMEMKRNAEDYYKKLKMISISLDKIQKDSCTLSEAIDIWKKLIDFFEKNCSSNEIQKLKDRYDMAITPPHFLANMLDPRYIGSRLSEEESDCAFQYLHSYYPYVIAEVINYQAQSNPFKSYLFHPQTVDNISPMAWWKALHNRNLISNDLNTLTTQLFTAVSSSAGIERLFSSFGFIPSKSRNRLGVEKYSKLLTIFKHLNK